MMLFNPEITRFLQRRGLRRMAPEAALIDMDGTLYDSMPLHSLAWERLAREEGWEFAEGVFYLHEGRTGRDTVRLFAGADIPAEDCDALYARKARYFRELPAPKPMPGAGRMLSTFRSLGIKRVLVTGSAQASLIERLDSDYPGAFSPEMRVTARDVNRGKPHPEPFLRAMEKAGVAAGHSIVVENAPLGVEAGHASGAFTVAVNTGPIPAEKLLGAGADILFRSMEEFADSLPLLIDAMKRIRL